MSCSSPCFLNSLQSEWKPVLVWPGLSARCPPKPLLHSRSSTGQRRGNKVKGSRVEIRTGRDHSPINVMDKTD